MGSLILYRNTLARNQRAKTPLHSNRCKSVLEQLAVFSLCTEGGSREGLDEHVFSHPPVEHGASTKTGREGQDAPHVLWEVDTKSDTSISPLAPQV